jgi:hypothetical protein
MAVRLSPDACGRLHQLKGKRCKRAIGASSSIPAFLANSVVEENPLKMMMNFHQLVKLDRYQGKKFSFIR